jgi:hypothetical protein
MTLLKIQNGIAGMSQKKKWQLSRLKHKPRTEQVTAVTVSDLDWSSITK